MDCVYLMLITQPGGEIQVNNYLPGSEELREKLSQQIPGDMVCHFHNTIHVDPQVPTSDVDRPIAGVQQQPR